MRCGSCEMRERYCTLYGVAGVGLSEGAREPAVVLVVVSRQSLLDSPECPRGAHPVCRNPELGGLGRVVVLPGARRPRRHESSPHTRKAACFVACFRLRQVPLDLHRRISGGSRSPRLPHLIDMAARPSGCMMPPSASLHERGPYPRPVGNRPFCPPTAVNPRHLEKPENQGSTASIMIARRETRCLPVIRVHCDGCGGSVERLWTGGRGCSRSALLWPPPRASHHRI